MNEARQIRSAEPARARVAASVGGRLSIDPILAPTAILPDADLFDPDGAEGFDLEDAGDEVGGTANARGDRRKGARRNGGIDRAFDASGIVEPKAQWFPRSWTYLLLSFAACIGLGCLWTGEAPERQVTTALVMALVCSACVGPAYEIVQERNALTRMLGTVIVVVAPLILFGFGITEWAMLGALPLDLAMSMLLLIGTIASVYLRRQPGMIFVAQLAIWGTMAVVISSVAALGALMVAFVLALLVNREQTEEQEVEEKIRAAKERVRTRARDILGDYEETRQGWFWETDRRSLLTYLSPPVAKALGRDPERMIGQPLVQLFDLDDTGDEGERTLMFHLSARSAFKELPVRAAITSEDRWWSISGRPIYDSFDNFVGFRGSGTDLTERRRSQEEASRLANYDSLTGLANRFQMSQALEKILKSQQQAHRHCAIMLLDLDRFKHVNDTLGHPAGDALLKQVSQRLERAVGQLGKVGRLGGDEFKVIIPGRRDREILADLAREIIHSLSQPYAIEGQRVNIGASIGIALAPDDGEDSDELIRNADLALYAAKDGGRGRYHFYAQDLHAAAEARAQLEEDLRDAIAKGDLQLFYQPVVSTATEKITGFEALLRWQHPVKGWIPPQKFVGTAEDTGLIAQLGEWALRTACHDLAQWPEDVRVAVNVSPLQFSNPQLPGIVSSAIAQAGIAPSRLELEITESVFLSDDEGTDAMFAALKKIGVRLALDDFGTGYASLGYLKKAPFDKIKIDQSFVRGATEKESRNGAIIASITSLAHALGMETTAEGVETLDELDLIRLHGCSHVQGFIYERPLDAESAHRRLETGLAAVARGPRSSRASRHTVLRKVVLEHEDALYNGTIRNISTTGALIEGLWNVPPGTMFRVQISQGFSVTCTAIWCDEDRMGVEFADPLQRDANGSITAINGVAPRPVVRKLIREAG